MLGCSSRKGRARCAVAALQMQALTSAASRQLSAGSPQSGEPESWKRLTLSSGHVTEASASPCKSLEISLALAVSQTTLETQPNICLSQVGRQRESRSFDLQDLQVSQGWMSRLNSQFGVWEGFSVLFHIIICQLACIAYHALLSSVPHMSHLLNIRHHHGHASHHVHMAIMVRRCLPIWVMMIVLVIVIIAVIRILVIIIAMSVMCSVLLPGFLEASASTVASWSSITTITVYLVIILISAP